MVYNGYTNNNHVQIFSRKIQWNTKLISAVILQ